MVELILILTGAALGALLLAAGMCIYDLWPEPEPKKANPTELAYTDMIAANLKADIKTLDERSIKTARDLQEVEKMVGLRNCYAWDPVSLTVRLEALEGQIFGREQHGRSNGLADRLAALETYYQDIGVIEAKKGGKK